MSNLKIHCIGDRDLEQFECSQPFAVISIASSPQLQAVSRWNRIPHCFDILPMFFHDIPFEELPVSGDLYYHGISETQAKGIVAFAKGAIAKRIEVIVCQCEVGISRSAGVAAALALVFNGDCMDYVDSCEKFPNVRVYGMVLKALLDAQVFKGLRIGKTPEEQLELNRPAMELLKTWIEKDNKELRNSNGIYKWSGFSHVGQARIKIGGLSEFTFNYIDSNLIFANIQMIWCEQNNCLIEEYYSEKDHGLLFFDFETKTAKEVDKK